MVSILVIFEFLVCIHAQESCVKQGFKWINFLSSLMQSMIFLITLFYLQNDHIRCINMDWSIVSYQWVYQYVYHSLE